MSHRIIEKRRRDRMNNCLADLSRLIPHHYMKKSRGRIEKTEIIEMAIKHLKHLQAHACKDLANCDVAKATEHEWQHQYRLGFQECTSEVVRFLVESEALFPGEGLCFRLMTHLQEHYDKLIRGCYSGRTSQQLMQEDTSTQMDVDNGSTLNLNGCVTDGFSITSVKRTDSPPPYDVQIESSPAVQEHQPPNRDAPVDDRCQVPASSQLREMLQNPNVPVERMRSNSTSSTTSVYSSRPYVTMYDGYPKGQSCEEVYKFKKNIKDRFNAGLHQHVDEMPEKFSLANVASSSVNSGPFPGPTSSKCSTSALMVTSTSLLETQNPTKNDSDNTDNNNCNNNNSNNIDVCPSTVNDGDLNSSNSQNDPQTDSSNGSSSPISNGRSNGSSSGYSTSGDAPNRIKLRQSRSRTPDRSLYPRHANYLTNGNRPDSPYLKPAIVPIFALHPKGNFYIPLSLESELIAPYLHNVDSSPVLHTVSISVNFCGPSSFSPPVHLSWQPQHSIPPQIQPNCYDRYNDQSY